MALLQIVYIWYILFLSCVFFYMANYHDFFLLHDFV